MLTLGTRRFWRPISGDISPEDAQIVKHQGYISVALQAVHYCASSRFWQKIFGGKDHVTLTSEITYRYELEPVTATSVEDLRVVQSNRQHFIPVGRLVALKVPADADGLELKVQITAIKEDNLELALKTLASPEFQKPLELAPPVVGQVLTITSLIKRLLTNAEPQKSLEASFSGILSEGKTPSPLENNRLLAGHLILISTEDTEHPLDRIEPSKLTVSGDGLLYNGEQVENTYLIYNISLDAKRGVNAKAPWHKTFQSALNRLDELVTAGTDQERAELKSQALLLWLKGCTLIDEDPMYLSRESDEIKKYALKSIQEKYNQLGGGGARSLSSETRVSDLFPGQPATIVPFGEQVLRNIERDAKAYAKQLGESGLLLTWKV